VRSYPKRPLVLLFPESILGSEPISRIASKRFLSRINSALSKHGNAFVFFSLLEHTGRGKHSNTGYIVTPSRTKKWQAYPKVAYWPRQKDKVGYNGAPTDYDVKIVRNSYGSVEDQFDHWVKRAQKIPDFPRIDLNGKTFELRICADLFQPKKVGKIRAGKKRRNVDVVVVPARGLDQSDIDPRKNGVFLNDGGSIITVDSKRGVSVHSNSPTLVKRMNRGILRRVAGRGIAVHDGVKVGDWLTVSRKLLSNVLSQHRARSYKRIEGNRQKNSQRRK